MVRFLGLRGFGHESPPREAASPSIAGGGNGWLIRFFDSSFFCEWIAVSYLYKHDHPGVRDYLCNRMYTLPLPGVEAYLFQLCYMLVHRPSAALDRYIVDICSKSLKIALKVHWYLAAELEAEVDEDGEDVDDSVARLQERCQVAATIGGEWPPLFRPQQIPFVSPDSPRSNPVLNRILSSKQKILLSLASSPVLGSSTPPTTTITSEGVKTGVTPSAEENKLLRRLSLGPSKVRDALFSRRSMEKDGDEEHDKEGFFKRLLRDGKEKDEEEGDREGFFKRLLRDSKDREKDREKDKEKEVEEGEREGLFKRLLRDKRDEGLGDDDERDGFFRRIFKDRNEDRRDAFLHEKQEEDEKISKTAEDEKDGFFRKIFKDKNEEKKDGRIGPSEDNSIRGVEEEKRDSFLKQLFKDRNEERRESANGRKDEDKGNKSPEDENFFRRLFKDRNEDKKLFGHDRREEKKFLGSERTDDGKCNGSIEEGEKENLFRRLFKDRNEEKRNENLVDRSEEDGSANGSIEEEEASEFLSFRRLLRVHPEESKMGHCKENGHPTVPSGCSPGTENFFKRLFRDRDRSVEDNELFGSRQKENQPGSPRNNEKQSSLPPLPSNTISELRRGAYHASLEFVQSLCDTSYGLVDIFPIEDRKIALQESLSEINSSIAAAERNGGICFPMGKGMYRVVHIPVDEAVLLNSREKAPYLVCVEVLKVDMPSSVKTLFDAHKLSKGGIPLANGDVQLPRPPPWAYPLWNRHDTQSYDIDRVSNSTSQAIDQAMSQAWEAKVKFVNVILSVEKIGRARSSRNSDEGYSTTLASASAQDLHSNGLEIDHSSDWVKVTLSAIPEMNMEDVDDQEPMRKKEHRRIPSTIAMEEVKAAAAKGHAPPGLPLKGAGQDHQNVNNNDVPDPTDALAGELWAMKKERIRGASVYGGFSGWDLHSFIVKSGDDCRQEHLAVQLISHFYDIYQEAGLPLWLRPYEILVTSSYTALIETIPNTASIHSIKSRFTNVSSLREFFIAKYGENSPNFKIAQRNFVESMAGYSILCFLLQVKDRHNGNLLIDEEGHIIHIDFGFMLSNSPGGVNFESAPFKLTRELLEVMDSDAEGTPSEFFDYFKVLCIQGFLTCRKHAERIILLVEMLQDSGFPCFKAGSRAIQNLRKRFHLNLTEEQCVSLVLSLISSSLDSWRTRQYDYYQRVLNGIL